MERMYALGGARQYPVMMELKYKIRSHVPRVGMGQTTWMSAREVAFTADRRIDLGTILEISIAWPALLHGRVPLQLVLEAEVTWCEESKLRARIAKHHFRTRGPWQREDLAQRPVVPYSAQSPRSSSSPPIRLEEYNELTIR